MNSDREPARTPASAALPYAVPGRARRSRTATTRSACSNDVNPPIWDGSRDLTCRRPSTWGSRGHATRRRTCRSRASLNINATQDVAISLTKVQGRHTLKAGFYNTHSYKAQQRGGWAGTINFGNDTNNPLDSPVRLRERGARHLQLVQPGVDVRRRHATSTTTPRATSRTTGRSASRLTLDYGVRLVRSAAAVRHARAGVELPPRQVGRSARRPLLYVAGLREQREPVHGQQPPGDESDRPASCSDRTRSLAHRRARAELGQHDQRPVPVRAGHRRRRRTRGRARARAALRHGVRPDRQSAVRPARRRRACSSIGRAATRSTRRCRIRRPYKSVTVRYGELQTLGQGGLTIEGPPALIGVRVRRRPAVVDAVERGRADGAAVEHGARRRVRRPAQLSHARGRRTSTPSTSARRSCRRTRTRRSRPTDVPGFDGDLDRIGCARSAATGRSRQQLGRGSRTYHSLQLSFNRRFSNGVSFGFNDTIGLYDHQQHRRRASSTTPTAPGRTAPIRRRPTSCSATTTPSAHTMKAQLRVGSAGPQERRTALRRRSAT